MAKYVVFSFDDGRKDTSLNAIKILKKYNYKCTINITTDFIENPGNFNNFSSASNLAMDIDEIKELYCDGFEIANHSAHHNNHLEDVLNANDKLKSWGIEGTLGFASPFSFLTRENNQALMSLVKKNELLYIRSGVQIRRKSFFYKSLYALQEIFHNKSLFYLLNKEKINSFNSKERFLVGVTVSKYTTLNQLKYFVKKMKNNQVVIFIFHSILDKTDPGYNADKWYWNIEDFDKFCKFLKNNNINVVRNKDLF